MAQPHITGISRFLNEKQIVCARCVDYKFKDEEDITWGYGNSYSDRYEVFKTAKVQKQPSFAFRSAESFLSDFNKAKEENNIDISKYKEGVRVYHKKFGEGTINYIEEEGEDYKVDINVDKAGHKRLMAKFAVLEIIE